MEYKKVSATEIEVTKTPVVAPIVNKYSLDFLKKQELDILKQMNDFIEARQMELDEVRGLITEAGTLGLKTQAEVTAEQVIVKETILEDNLN
jgi:hypothetical protein